MPHQALKNRPEGLPPDTLKIRDGKVWFLEEWTLWNQAPSNTLMIEKLGHDHYRCYAGEPEHGGGTKQGSLEEVLTGLHANFAAAYRYIFSLVELDPERHYQMLTGYELEFEPMAIAA
jgi:hypothetical protein